MSEEEKIDLRKNYFNFRTTDEVSQNKLVLEYAWKVRVLTLLEKISSQLEKLEGGSK
jgi:hypothetical protein